VPGLALPPVTPTITGGGVPAATNLMRRRINEAYRDLVHHRLGVPWMKVRPTDCFVTSFPRSGNTWMRYMISNALDPEADRELPELLDFMPMIDWRDAPTRLRKMDDTGIVPRLLMTHEPFRPYLLGGRTAYLLRDGRDAVVSYHHYRVNRNRMKISQSDYLRRSLAGRFRYGSWQAHVEGWWQQQDHPNVCIVRYEDMMENAALQLRRVLDHFGLEVPDDHVQFAVQRSSVERVSKGFTKVAAARRKQFSGGTGGGHGKWREKFSAEDLTLFMKHAGPMLKTLGYASASSAGASSAGATTNATTV